MEGRDEELTRFDVTVGVGAYLSCFHPVLTSCHLIVHERLVLDIPVCGLGAHLVSPPFPRRVCLGLGIHLVHCILICLNRLLPDFLRLFETAPAATILYSILM